MIRLILVRHGNTFEEGQPAVQIGAKTDLPLTSFGLLQAKQMAQYLAKHNIHPKAIFAGNLQRQTQFASFLGSPLMIESALTEIDYGAWEGLTSREIAKQWPQEYTDWEQKGQWAEAIFKKSAQSHKTALDHWFNHLRNTYGDGDVLLGVSSNGLLRLLTKGEKVKTGHFCDLLLLPQDFKINGWNLNPTV